MKLLVIKQVKDGWYKVTDLFTEYSPIEYDAYSKALDLCRIRTHKTLINDVSIFKVPFINMWLVW